MAAQRSSPEQAELTRLREQVRLLETRLSELNRTEQSLAESRELFDAFMGRMPVLAWMKDESGRYRYANRAFARVIRDMQASVLGLSDDDLWPADIAAKIRESDNKALAASIPEERVEAWPLPDGDRHFRVVRFRFFSRSSTKYCGGVALEITDRVHLEQRLNELMTAEESARTQAISMLGKIRQTETWARRLFESPVAGVMLCDGDLILDANDKLLSWLELNRSEINDSPPNWRKITPAQCHDSDERALAELRSAGSFNAYEKEFVTVSGRRLPVIVGGVALDSPAGEYLCFVLNVSERKQMEQRLLQSQKLESLGMISSGVAHDFNNLLVTIMGNSALAAETLSREHPAFRPLGEVQIASRRASELTQQMLSYAGRRATSIQPVDLSSAIREIGGLLETTIPKKVRLNLNLAAALPLIEGDEGQIQQIIMNLVINAAEAIGENTGEIRVSTRLLNSFDRAHASGDASSVGWPASSADGHPSRWPARYVTFEVSDTGCGMSEETKARIFDPFFTTKKNGRGIGLATVLSIVRNHQGSLLVESEPGQGTTFRVLFPASEKQNTARPQPTPSREQLWGNETILVADDDEGIRRMNRLALERFGYRVLLAADGDEAVRLYRQHRDEIAVVLLDWAMPVMNGDEAMLRILEIDPSACVLMSSGYAETTAVKRGGKPLIAGFVQKPYTTTQIVERLRQAIASRPRQKPAAAGASSAGIDSMSSDS